MHIIISIGTTIADRNRVWINGHIIINNNKLLQCNSLQVLQIWLASLFQPKGAFSQEATILGIQSSVLSRCTQSQ